MALIHSPVLHLARGSADVPQLSWIRTLLDCPFHLRSLAEPFYLSEMWVVVSRAFLSF